MEPDWSLPFSQELTTGPNPEANESSLDSPSLFFKINFSIIL